MADTKISDLTDGNPALAADYIPVARAAAPFVTRRVSVGSILTNTTTSTLVLGDNKIVLGDLGVRGVKSLTSLGTVTTLLHGNASGAPTWGLVDLANEVSGILPYTKFQPAGSTTHVQYNAAGVLAGSAGLTWDDTNRVLSIAGAMPGWRLTDTTASAKSLAVDIDADEVFFYESTAGARYDRKLPVFNLSTQTTGIGDQGRDSAALSVDGTYMPSSASINPVMGGLFKRNDSSAISLNSYAIQGIAYNNNTNTGAEIIGILSGTYAGPNAAGSTTGLSSELFSHSTAANQTNGINIGMHPGRTSNGADYQYDIKGLQIIEYLDFAVNYTNYFGQPAWGTPTHEKTGHAIFISGTTGYKHFITALAPGGGGSIFGGAVSFQVRGDGNVGIGKLAGDGRQITIQGQAAGTGIQIINSAGTKAWAIVFNGDDLLIQSDSGTGGIIKLLNSGGITIHNSAGATLTPSFTTGLWAVS